VTCNPNCVDFSALDLPDCSGMPSFRDTVNREDDPLRCSLPLWGALGLFEGARAWGASRAELLRRLGVPAAAGDDDQWRIPLERTARVLRWASRRTRDELAGLWCKPVPPGTFAVVMAQMLRCATLGEALTLGLRLYRVAAPGFPLRLRVRGPLAWLEIPAGKAGSLFFDVVCVYWVLCTARWLAGRPISVAAASMSRPAPDARYREPQPFFETTPAYGAVASGVAFDAGWLHRPIARGADELPAFLRAVPANLMRSQGVPVAAAHQVRAQLQQQLRGERTGALPSLDCVAIKLGTSPRALRRRLQAEGVNFLRLRESVLQELALQWVVATDLSLAEIGGRLGFSDASTFHRAFKRWTGAAPGECRRLRGASRTAALPERAEEAAVPAALHRCHAREPVLVMQ
jgi:AraC-like DNA-binding protein